MNLLRALVLIAALYGASALASEGSTYQPNKDQPPHPSGSWSCTTSGNGQKVKVVLATSLTQAQDVAVKYCQRNGGSFRECVRNLDCEFVSDQSTSQEPQELKPFYDWGSGQNGYGYCYLFNVNGSVMNDGKPVANFNCDMSATYYEFAADSKGAQACYQWTPYGKIMDEGKTLDPVLCRKGEGFPKRD